VLENWAGYQANSGFSVEIFHHPMSKFDVQKVLFVQIGDSAKIDHAFQDIECNNLAQLKFRFDAENSSIEKLFLKEM
jgi:hypothetical protein